MAQNITLLNASYTDVPGVQLPKTGGGTALFSDASITTAVESDVASGKLFLKADGSIGTGTGSTGGCDVTQDENGYIVLPEQGGGGGGSSWTLLDSTEVQVSNPGSSATVVHTFTDSNAWTGDKLVVVRVRDKAGRRTGYYIGSDSFFMNQRAATGLSVAFSVSMTYNYYDSSGSLTVTATTSSSRNGIYAKSIAPSGGVDIYANALSGTTIDGTYVVELFTLDYSDGLSPYNI